MEYIKNSQLLIMTIQNNLYTFLTKEIIFRSIVLNNTLRILNRLTVKHDTIKHIIHHIIYSLIFLIHAVEQSNKLTPR